MPTFSNSPIPREDPAQKVVPVPEAEALPVTADVPVTENDTHAVSAPAEEPVPTANPEEPAPMAEAPATEQTAEESATDGSTSEPASEPVQAPAPQAPSAPRAAFRTTPDDGVIIRNFGTVQSEAINKLNRDFGLSLDHHGFTRLQRLFRDTLKRAPTAGELRLLDALDKAGRGQPDREAVGELYTDSPAIAETWADMMDKHNRLHAA
jgi:hypothetical protein